MKDSRKNLLKTVIVSTLSLIMICVMIWTEWYIKKKLTTVVICGEEYKLTVSEIDLSGKDFSDDTENLFKLHQLKYADLTDTGISAETYDSIQSRLPGCTVSWSVPFGGEYYKNDITGLTVSPDVSASDMKNLRYFTALTSLDASHYPLCDELFDATAELRKPDSGCSCTFSSTLYGSPIDAESTRFDFSDKVITDLSEFYRVLRFFPNVREIYLGDVSVPDKDVSELNKAFPDTSVIWLVEFARWQARTDIKVFSTLIGAGQRKTFDEKELYPLIAYCTELRALDLGHNHMSDISALAGLKKLEVLILSGNTIDNIEAVGSLTHLNYLEVFNCDGIEDLSPLASCTELENLMLNNMGNVRNASVIENCKKLSLLYARNTTPENYSWKDLKKALPKCTIDTKTYHIYGEWRNSKRNYYIRHAFNNWTKIQTYNSWDDFVIGKTALGWRIY